MEIPMTYQTTEEGGARLTPEQFRVTQQSGTEPAGTGALLHENRPGIYVDIVSGEPLFASSAKFESHCGWPSFTKPIEPSSVQELGDDSYGMRRIEVRPVHGDSPISETRPLGKEWSVRSNLGGMRLSTKQNNQDRKERKHK